MIRSVGESLAFGVAVLAWVLVASAWGVAGFPWLTALFLALGLACLVAWVAFDLRPAAGTSVPAHRGGGE